MFKSIRLEKGDIAEAPETVAGLRENMSQTVTKVESYHWLKAVTRLLYIIIPVMYDHEFSIQWRIHGFFDGKNKR